MGNRAEAVEVVIGAMAAGLWITPVNRHLQAEEIAHVLEDSGARVVIADAEHAAVARAAGATVSSPATNSTARSRRRRMRRSISTVRRAAR